MLNKVILVGRITEKLDNGIQIAVARSYKNEQREYETDFIRIILKGEILKSTQEYCEKGDLVGVNGRLENIKDEKDIKKELNVVIAEKVSFLSSKKENIKGKKCKYCGEPNGSEDENVLCEKCREDFGHTFYSEL